MVTRLLSAPLVVCIAFTGALAASPAQASRTVNQSYTVPSDGVLRLTGHGFGHGHGMSQYGAQGAALRGLTHQQILAFYYPGTTLGTTSGSMRVRLLSAGTGSLVVTNASGLRVRSAGSTASYDMVGTGVSQWRLRKSGSTTVLDSYDGSWHNGVRTLAGAAELYGPTTLGLRDSGSTKPYRGALRLTTEGYPVSVVGVDDYVRGVVASEMPASWQASALRSQSVAARTYGAFDRAAHTSRSYDTCDTTSCQVYGGVGREDSRSNAAVTATAAQVLTYDGAPAFTQFSSSSGGWTSAGSQPYLPAKADPYDSFSGNSVHTWSTAITRAAVAKAWPSLGTLARVVVTQRDGNGEWYGRVEKVVLDGTRSNVTVSGDTFRSKLGLRSSWFTFGSSAGSTGSTTTPSSTPVAGQATAITLRWQAIGGYRSIVRGPTAAERAVSDGSMRVFARGRIYASPTAGAHELYGKVLRKYLKRGGPTGRLGFPTTSPHRVKRGVAAGFEHGVLKVFRSGRVKVTVR